MEQLKLPTILQQFDRKPLAQRMESSANGREAGVPGKLSTVGPLFVDSGKDGSTPGAQLKATSFQQALEAATSLAKGTTHEETLGGENGMPGTVELKTNPLAVLKDGKNWFAVQLDTKPGWSDDAQNVDRWSAQPTTPHHLVDRLGGKVEGETAWRPNRDAVSFLSPAAELKAVVSHDRVWDTTKGDALNPLG
jgi:hypothetical protein